MKYSMYQYRNFIIAFSALGLIGIMAGCLDISISFESTNPENTSPIVTNNDNNGEMINLDTIPSNSVESSRQKNQPTVVAYPVNSDSKTKVAGSLRMSNKTTQPVRLAILARQSSLKNGLGDQTKFDIPAHWDFAPEEGSQKGLLLSLPQGNLKLEKGDILVAFAQDGSRSYWGPYVVGEGSTPKWDSQTQEWQLVLENR
ncbi:MAG: hypothetical protein ACKO3K_07415 [Cuspidothrix sp.]